MKQREHFDLRLRTTFFLIVLFCLVFISNSWGNTKQASLSVDEGTDIVVTGELTVLFIDDFEHRSAKIVYQLKEFGSDRVFNLHFKNEPPGKLRTGAVVTVHGKAKDRDIYLMADIGGTQVQQVVSSAPAVAGDQKTIVIVANFVDTTVACSVPDIEYRVFSDPLNNSVDALYRDMSFGQLWLTGDVVGPFTINYSTTSACDIAAWASAADAAGTASGIDLSAYNRKIYVLPKTNPCGYIGVGTVGGNPSRAWIFRCDISDTYAHEFGHNLGMNHASTLTDEYGDTSDIMGYGGYGLREINGPHQDQMGWLNPLQMGGIVESGIYSIAPLELDASQATTLQVLIIQKPDTGDSYYLTYRQGVGFDSVLGSSYLQGVNIHRYKTDTANRTYLLAVLDDGQSFTDTVNGITVTQITHSSGYVTVQIQMNPAAVCTVSAPTLSVSPAGQSAYAGSALSYAVRLTNMDNTNCQPATFTVAASVPSSWVGSVTPGTLTLSPGATASVTLTATSPSSTAAGDYAVTASVSDTATAAHAASRTVTYSVIPKPVCTTAAPAVSLSPATQSGSSGATLSYTVSVTNNDSSDCAATTFSLGRTIPSGWSGTMNPATLTLSPGAGASATLSVTSPTTAVPGSYNISASVSDTCTAVHSVSAGGIYSVAGDTVAPSAPMGMTAKFVRGKVNLLWTASTDNVKVTGYKVWRNDALLGQTTGTSYTDAAVTSGLTYTYFVTAFDAAGNISAASSYVSVTVSNNSAGKKK